MYKKLYESGIYGRYLKIFGIEKGIDSFLQGINFECLDNIKILEAGCGNGIIGMHLLKRFGKSTLLATDLEKNTLNKLIVDSNKAGISSDRISVGLSDITNPTVVTFLDNSFLDLKPGSFDIVCVGGVIGYSKNQIETIKTLLSLIKPDGYFVDIELNNKFWGKLISYFYNYPIISAQQMKEVIEEQNYKVSIIPFTFKNFPANLTRYGIVARKR